MIPARRNAPPDRSPRSRYGTPAARPGLPLLLSQHQRIPNHFTQPHSTSRPIVWHRPCKPVLRGKRLLFLTFQITNIMFKLLVLLSFFQLSAFESQAPAIIAPSVCPEVTDLQKDGQTSNSITFSWSSSTPTAQYRVWYVRHSDNAFSGYFYTSSPGYCFSGLSADTYTFYVQAICGHEFSEYIGIEDCIPA